VYYISLYINICENRKHSNRFNGLLDSAKNYQTFNRIRPEYHKCAGRFTDIYSYINEPSRTERQLTRSFAKPHESTQFTFERTKERMLTNILFTLRLICFSPRIIFKYLFFIQLFHKYLLHLEL
jgi:hypothetical protein